MKSVEKVAYLKGLTAGLNLSPDKPESKMFAAIMDILTEIAERNDDLEERLELIGAQLDEVDHDLGQLEEYVLADGGCDCDDGCECDCGCEEDDEPEYRPEQKHEQRHEHKKVSSAKAPEPEKKPEPEEEEPEYYEVECPSCHEIICVDEGVLDDGSIECPNCGEKLEFEIEFE